MKFSGLEGADEDKMLNVYRHPAAVMATGLAPVFVELNTPEYKKLAHHLYGLDVQKPRTCGYIDI